jgi:DNA-directed RNA polymerase subunit RPC12/RpoP
VSGDSSHVCPRCGARRLFRSRSRSGLERLLRALTPFRVYRCHACGLRTWTFGRAASLASDQKELGLPARPLEKRDSDWWRRRRMRLLLTAIVAAAIGAAVAKWFVLD